MLECTWERPIPSPSAHASADDPEFPTYKANYREFLQQSSQFHQPVAIRDGNIARKVHGTYRLQFLKDVVLARSIDDSTFNVLNSCIIFNQIDIIAFVQQDPAFLQDVIAPFCDSATLQGAPLSPAPLSEAEAAAGPDAGWTHEGDAHRAELTLLVQQLCAMGKNVQLPARIALFRTLVDRGLLFCAQWALGVPERAPAGAGARLIAAAGEVLATVLDHALDPFRAHVNRQVARFREHAARVRPAPGAKAETALLVMCRVMARSRDLAVQSLVGDALKLALEVPLPEAEAAAAITPMKMLSQTKANNPDGERFVMYFYTDCADTLFKPLEDIPEARTFTRASVCSAPSAPEADVRPAEPTLQLSREKANLYLYLCDILTAAAQQHKVESHNWIHRSGCAARLATLLRARDKHLRLAALRFFRMLVRGERAKYFEYLRRHGVLGPILDLALREARRDNLLSGSCQELFDYLRRVRTGDGWACGTVLTMAVCRRTSRSGSSMSCGTTRRRSGSWRRRRSRARCLRASSSGGSRTTSRRQWTSPRSRSASAILRYMRGRRVDS
jgi:protein phosphatase-4 regulatory subunit 3